MGPREVRSNTSINISPLLCADETNSDTRFGHPLGAAVDSAGNVYMTDSNSNAILQWYPAIVAPLIINSNSASMGIEPTPMPVPAIACLPYAISLRGRWIEEIAPLTGLDYFASVMAAWMLRTSRPPRRQEIAPS